MYYIEKFAILFLRLSMGWMFFWSGITKVLDPQWSAEGYIKAAKHFSGMYDFFLQPDILPWVNLINEWGMVLLGISLILGVFVSVSALLGVVLMILYYLALDFPHPNAHSYIVDEHIIYAGVLLLLAALGAGKVWGVDSKFDS